MKQLNWETVEDIVSVSPMSKYNYIEYLLAD